MPARSEERTEFLTDVLSTAIEGGISYWAKVSAYRWESTGLALWTVPPRDEKTTEMVKNVTGPCAVIMDAEDEEHPYLLVTLDTIAHGMSLYCGNTPVKYLTPNPSVIQASRTNGEEGDFDAGDADNILQIGIFNEVVYG